MKGLLVPLLVLHTTAGFHVPLMRPASKRNGLQMVKTPPKEIGIADAPPARVAKQQVPAQAVPKQQRVFLPGQVEGNKILLGGKGAALCDMARLGLPIPPFLIISTDACKQYFENDKQLPEDLVEEYLTGLKDIESRMGKKFGDPANPLLVSVRSGAPASMPGMMDTVLNLGINDEIAAGMAQRNARWAYDTQRRFIQMFSNVVMGMSSEPFEEAIHAVKAKRGVEMDVQMTAEDMKELVERFQAINPAVPSDPYKQLDLAVKAVFQSWYNPRAIRYRSYNNIPSSWGTAVNIQAMAFGNINMQSGTGVAFSRNPSTGERVFFGEFLPQAAGEDVVAGIRTPQPLSELRDMWPAVYQELDDIQILLEKHYKDMQDLEFTVEDGKLFMLQCRSGKRTATAAVKMAVDMYEEGLITEQEALLRVPAAGVDFFLHSTIDPKARPDILAVGLPASPGAATGQIVFTPEAAETAASNGKKTILVRRETTPEDIHGMKAAEGILTELGGMTSHAAVVARGMGRACVSGCGGMKPDIAGGTVTFAAGPNGSPVTLKEGDVITIDGTSGKVMLGEVARIAAEADHNFQQVLAWADKYRKLKVLANVDTPEDAVKARQWGAEGVGLCRTEHMFFQKERIDVMRAMILSVTPEERQKHLDELFEFQRDDIEGLLRAMDGLPVAIRLLDPPLHEFLPHEPEAVARLATKLNLDQEKVRRRIADLAEVNPMLGFRGCRLSVVYPEISEMQARSVAEAAAKLRKEGLNPIPEIMVPVVSSALELNLILPRIRKTCDAIFEREQVQVDLHLGTMIELPRACLLADQIADTGVSFMSFGTNDLTQTTYGFSRDDMARFLPAYIDNQVMEGDPFVAIDQDGVGQLIQLALEKAAQGKKNTGQRPLAGVCGEHGGNPDSVEWMHRQGMDYVSCSPYRLAIARVAAGQAAVRPSNAPVSKPAGATTAPGFRLHKWVMRRIGKRVE